MPFFKPIPAKAHPRLRILLIRFLLKLAIAWIPAGVVLYLLGQNNPLDLIVIGIMVVVSAVFLAQFRRDQAVILADY